MQVVHFDTMVSRPLSAWVKGVNAHLPASVVVRWAHPVPDEFHARFAAHGRLYEYVLVNRAVRPAIFSQQTGWFHLPLDLVNMQSAAALLIGTHDFSAFRSAECQARSPVRELRSLEISRHGDIIRFSLEANAFLHHMVRNIVGSLVYVGKGRYPSHWVADVLRSRDRGRAAPTFPPQGLYLAGVTYEAKWGLPMGIPESALSRLQN
jgi:tRNA pseudouridine38-40 synthase